MGIYLGKPDHCINMDRVTMWVVILQKKEIDGYSES